MFAGIKVKKRGEVGQEDQALKQLLEKEGQKKNKYSTAKKWEKEESKTDEPMEEPIMPQEEDEDIDINEMCNKAIDAFYKCEFDDYEELHQTLTKTEQVQFIQNEKAIEQTQKDIQLNQDQSNSELFKGGLVNELIDEKRKLMLQIRSCDPESKQYDVVSDQFDSAFIGKKLKKRDLKRLMKKDEKAEKNAFRRRQKILSNCKFCYYNNRIFESKLVIASSSSVYLGVPTEIGTLCEDHLIISPKEHYSATNQCEEDIAQEIRSFKLSLVGHFGKKGKSVVFLETAIDLESIPHIQIDCIPIESDLEEDVKLFFKKALTEDDEEWSTHKKIYDTVDSKGDIQAVIPANFSYFHLDINAKGGFAHVIEDSRKFNRIHVLEVLSSCVGEEHPNFNVPHRYEELRKKVKKFKEKYSFKSR
ncbi:unnamed protein product [Moneuplotes crassus]|uniref:Uncharacterized protein n=1 Tax=Euplotes crassus TaxID=5936 RepID=A0AAD1UL26_EUPCR|nr:unnamed protein product [Moneuplotes crassus]